jgi:tRNA pseudouridine55 synthase
MKGIIAVYKPKGPTSHDIIDQIRKVTGERKVGHAGTLDPLASGVLVVAIGREATRRLSLEVKKEKEYLAEIKFGMNSITDDEEGEKTIWPQPLNIPDKKLVKETLLLFVGEITQMPPAYSALKIKGTSAYKLARKGLEVKLAERQVTIKQIELLNYTWPFLKIKVVCGPGVYIRALARDIGNKLGVGGYLTALERTRVGDFKIEEAVKVEQLEK